MTTVACHVVYFVIVVEAYRLDRYDNFAGVALAGVHIVVEAYRLDRYDNQSLQLSFRATVL